MNRISRIILLVWALALANCAPVGSRPSSANMAGTTGYTNPEGFDYVANGDSRVEKALRAKPNTPSPTPVSPVNGKQALRERLKEFEFARFNGKKDEASRFGEHHVTFKVIFANGEKSLQFKADLKGAKPKFTFSAENAGYALTGELNDSEHQTLGEFTLTEASTKDSAQILYWVYKAKTRVRENRAKPTVAGSGVEKQIAELRDNTFGWVHNFNVVRGISFFLVDIVKITPQNTPLSKTSLFSFKGPSLRTGEAVHDLDEVAGAPGKVQLVGNGEESAGRIFQVTMQDAQTKQNSEFMLDVELDPQTKAAAPKSENQTPEIPDGELEEPEVENETPAVAPAAPVQPPAQPAAPTQTPTPGVPPVTAPKPKPAPPQTQSPAKPAAPAAPAEPVRTGHSYLRISNTLTRTARMTKDFNRNRNLPGVKTWIRTYETSWRGSLENFYFYANPFRRVIEKIGQAMDVSPAFAYLTVIESAYFTGGNYKVQGNSQSSALGPFQLLFKTAQGLGMMVGGEHDERRYFVPSACGAARYVAKLADIFDDSDATVLILAYFQGDGGAAAAIYCSFDPNAGNRQACAQRINKGYTGKDYKRFLKLAKNYDYSYAEMDLKAAIPKEMREYVNKKLAVYFISNDMTKYNFSTAGAPTALPENDSVMPKRALKDRLCQSAVAGVL